LRGSVVAIHLHWWTAAEIGLAVRVRSPAQWRPSRRCFELNGLRNRAGGWGGQPPHLLRPQSEFRDLAVQLWGAQMERTAQAVCSAVAGQVRLGGALTGAAERTARLLGALLVGPRCAVGSVRVGSQGSHSESCVFRSGRATAAQIAACGSDDWERACKGRSVRIPCYCAIPAVVIQCSRTIGRDSGGELCTRSDAVSAVLRRCQSFAMGTSTAGGGIVRLVGCARSVPGVKSA